MESTAIHKIAATVISVVSMEDYLDQWIYQLATFVMRALKSKQAMRAARVSVVPM